MSRDKSFFPSVLCCCYVRRLAKQKMKRQQQNNIEKRKQEGRIFFSPWKADELMGSSTRSMASPFQEKHKKWGVTKEKSDRPTDRCALKEIGGLNDS
jgi:hypothetical protein